MLIKIHGNLKLICNFLVGCGQKWVWSLWSQDTNITASQEESGINKFFACCYKFKKAKSYLNNFWVGLVKNSCGYFGHGTLQLTVCQEGIDELG